MRLYLEVGAVPEFRLVVELDEYPLRSGCGPENALTENFWSTAQTNSSMYTLSSLVDGAVVKGVLDTVLFWNTTFLKRVESGELQH